ncbi:NAD-dependent epimerase/dehydratase family protein [Paenibacillus sp. GCM10023248]|uniref:NAD-dependent epimerase/dehydratase family protein n=1 Tax=unclassified Paenibacillus TaxID=185978 RepID=UPI0023782BD6|nr:NAD-dependent epimerase/dehydratase [Paenibacillus sp. MAHUQ-63]MDD9266606.1 NAD-dependent epimerase/dehydratase [Paenibacillus sp. MAHUQ-63]
MNILITGATGFLGSYVTHHFLKEGHNLIILKRSYSNTIRIDSILNEITSYDIDQVSIETVFKENNIDIVIHAATNYGKTTAAHEVIESNVVFPLKLLELLTDNKGIAFINTDSFFNNNNAVNYGYLNTYSLSKKYFLELATIFCGMRKFKFINMRLEHLYGPNDDLSKFTMETIDKLLKNIDSMNLTPGKQNRDFIYVTDAVDAYSCVLGNIGSLEDSIHTFQVGSGAAVTIEKFVIMAKQLTGAKTQLNFGSIPYRDNEIMHSLADNEPLRRLGWESKIGLMDGIGLIIESIQRK